ncbi:MAG: hypothetical protein ACYTEQ_04435 [Planctomycetota bacterium]
MDWKQSICTWTTLSIMAVVPGGGCASTEDTNKRWVGRPAKELVAAWGEPDGTVCVADGRKLLTWTSFVSPGQVLPCRWSVTISPEGLVERFGSSGCPPRRPTPIYRRGGGALPEEVRTRIR